MIACEKEFVLIEQDHVASSMSRGRYRNQVSSERHCGLTLNNGFYTKSPGAVRSVHNPGTTELTGKSGMIGDVILMSQKHRAEAAERCDPGCQMSVVPW